MTKLTPEQDAIIEAGKSTQDSLLINALAGVGKTFTLVVLAQKMPLVPTLSVAFNKRIAVEMAQRFPSHVTAATLNSVGHRAWGERLGRRATLNADKSYDALSNNLQGLQGEDKKNLGEMFAGVLRGVRTAKSMGYVPPKFHSVGRSLCTIDELIDNIAASLDYEPDDFYQFHVEQVLEQSIAQAFEGVIDFDDQIYMSTLFGARYPKYAVTMVDEAQDLSPLNHESLRLMFGGRLIAVGDPNQSIYAFRGAHMSSMQMLKDQFNMRELPLSISFRCPKAVVIKAQSRVPHFQYAETAIEGKVEKLETLQTADIPDGAAIICRNNAPILSCALRLIRAGRSVKIVGSDIGKSLITLMKKLTKDDEGMKSPDFLEAIKQWEIREIEKARESRKGPIMDRAECMRAFVNDSQTAREAIVRAEYLFNLAGKIELLTGHKAKGLEWDTVYHLDPWRVPSKFAKRAAEDGENGPMEQELNLRYVIETRAKVELFLIDLDDII